ncbi:SPFH/Band 7/PHB domain protein [Candidatus Babeliales bacterium]|nr:SPFH/Band 7/PHB domain protein [Candidatus Babeliales bacterium]
MIVEGFIIFFICLVLFVMLTISRATYLVQQSEVIVVERLGRFHSLLTPGLHFVVPFIDLPRSTMWTMIKPTSDNHWYRYYKNVSRIDLREAVYDFPKQNVITKDNVTMEINALLYYQITDPKCAMYEVQDLPLAIEQLTQTTLRDVIGSMDLDETLSSRSQINERLRIILDEATDKWGVRINRVELKDVNPPHEIRIAMEKQMKAERDRRALILEAEGAKRAAILEAEGYKEAKITHAEGDAQARLNQVHAESESLKVLRNVLPENADPTAYLIALNYIKALPEMMKGKDDKMIIVPYEASSLVGSLATIKELFDKTKK